jgi:hypothetical protein
MCMRCDPLVVHVSILGPLLVEHDGAPREIAGGRLQALLARLAIDAGRPVSHGALVDAVWDGVPPRDEQHALQSLVSRLRRALGDPALIVQEAAGYRLALTPDSVDALRFERLAREGAAALRAGDPAGAGRLLTEALDLWRGEPAADALRLHDVRLAARTAAGSRSTSCPATRAVPPSGRSSVARIRTAVVFPAPFGPRTPSTVPREAARSTPSSATVAPKRLVSPAASMARSCVVVMGALSAGALAARSHGAHMGSHGARTAHRGGIMTCARIP